MLPLALAAVLAIAGVAQAEMTLSPRSPPRPAVGSSVTGVVVVLAPSGATLRPMPRPVRIARMLQTESVAPLLLSLQSLRLSKIRPMPRPAVLRNQVPALPVLAPVSESVQSEKNNTTDGFVCGDPEIRGDELAPVRSKVKGCGILEPVRVTSINGIWLRGPVIVECSTMVALKKWIDKGMRPTFVKKVIELQIAGTYVCRPSNNVRGNKISEHGRGKAVDISAFVFADGSEWTILGNYNRHIRKAYKAACGIFGTTLGPGSDGYHEDHLHFDTVGYRNGPYCR